MGGIEIAKLAAGQFILEVTMGLSIPVLKKKLLLHVAKATYNS